MKLLSLLSLLFLPVSGHAAKAVMEGIQSSNGGVFISTREARANFNAQNYTGSVSSVGVYSASNTVVGDCVLYSTGSVTCDGRELLSSGEVWVASATLSASTSAIFGADIFPSTGPAVYKLYYRFVQDTSDGFPQVVLNGYTASNYRWAAKNNCDNTDETQARSQSDTAIRLASGSDCTTGFACEGEVTIQQIYPDGRAFVRWNSSLMATNVITCSMYGTGTLANVEMASPLHHIEFKTSAGAMTGTIDIYRVTHKR